MTETAFVSIISASATALVGITALILSYRVWNSIERRLEIIEKDLKEFYKLFADHDKRITLLEKQK